MKCPRCSSSETEITNTRKKEQDNLVWRKRKCKQCDKTFSTLETVDEQQLRVQPRAGATKEKFDPHRLMQKLLYCLHDQRNRQKKARHLLEDITAILHQRFDDTVSTDDIQLTVADRLAQLDARLAARYNAMRTIDETIALPGDEQDSEPNIFDDRNGR